MEDSMPGDLEVAGDAGKGVSGVQSAHIAAAAVAELARSGALPADRAAAAIRELDIDPEKLDPALP